MIGLKINLSKSEIIPIGEEDDADLLTNIFGLRVVRLTMKYLGLPLGASYKYTNIWSDIVEKMERRLAGWKRLYFLKRGRLTVIKNALSNLLTYYMSLFPILVGVAKRLEKLQRYI